MDLYIKGALRVSVAHICQTIGYSAIRSIPLELLLDSLHRFLQEFTRDLHRHVELFNRTEANLYDVAITLNNLNVNLNDLFDYFHQVQPVSFVIDIPQLPAPTISNFLKYDGEEFLTRPAYINKLPRIEETSTSYTHQNVKEIVKATGNKQLSDSNTGVIAIRKQANIKRMSLLQPPTAATAVISVPRSEVNRNKSSVTMTSDGFICSSIEGKMPESIIPDIVEKYFGMDAPSSVFSNAAKVLQQSIVQPPTASTSTQNLSHLSSIFHSSIKGKISSDSFVHGTDQVLNKNHLKEVPKKPVTLITTTI